MNLSFLKSRGTPSHNWRQHARDRFKVLPGQQDPIMLVREGGQGRQLQGRGILRQAQPDRVPHAFGHHPQLVGMHTQPTQTPERRHGHNQAPDHSTFPHNPSSTTPATRATWSTCPTSSPATPTTPGTCKSARDTNATPNTMWRITAMGTVLCMRAGGWGVIIPGFRRSGISGLSPGWRSDDLFVWWIFCNCLFVCLVGWLFGCLGCYWLNFGVNIESNSCL